MLAYPEHVSATPARGPRSEEEIATLVKARFTGCRTRDLAGFSLEEFDTASYCWDDEQMKRYCADEAKRRLTGRE